MAKNVAKGEELLTLTFSDGKIVRLRKPSKMVVDMMLTKGRQDPLDMASVLLKNCIAEGDRSVIGNLRYETEVLKQMDDICGKVNCEVEWKDDEAHVTFQDGKVCVLGQIDRKSYSDVLKKMRTSPLGAIERLVNKLKVSGDDVTSEPGYLMGLADVLDELTQTVPARLGEP